MKDPENPRANSIGFGFGRPIYSEASDLGGVGTPSNTMIGLGAGYGIHRYLILGARLGFNLTRAGQRTDDPATAKDSNVVFVGGFIPYLEILPLPEGKGRFLPYVLVRTGFSGSTLTSSGDKDGERYLLRTSTIAPVLGIGGGAHAFLTQYFSIDFGLTFDYRWIHSRARGNFPGEPEIKSEWQRAGQGFTLALVLGMSTWF